MKSNEQNKRAYMVFVFVICFDWFGDPGFDPHPLEPLSVLRLHSAPRPSSRLDRPGRPRAREVVALACAHRRWQRDG